MSFDQVFKKNFGKDVECWGNEHVMSTRRSYFGLTPWYPFFNLSHSSSSEDQVPVKEIRFSTELQWLERDVKVKN